MVGREYLLHKPAPPSSAKVVFDQRVVPAMIDMAGAVEAVLERLAVRTRSAPGPVLATAFSLGLALSLVAVRRR